MSLFTAKDLKDYSQPEETTHGEITADSTAMESLVFQGNKSLNEKLTTVEMGKSYHYVSAGMFSMHELLFKLLEFTGPASVYAATWTITETPVRMLIDAMQKGLITEFNCLFDIRVRIRNPQVFQLTQFNLSKVRLAPCHAKVLAIANKDWHIAVVGSANFTNNPRIEAGVICCDKAITDFHRGWIDAALNKAPPLEL